MDYFRKAALFLGLLNGQSDSSAKIAALENELCATRDALKRAQYKSKTDPLTELSNRAGSAEELPKMFAALLHGNGSEGRRRTDSAAGFYPENSRIMVRLAFDIDHFKSVNDTYGHLAGDQVLKEVAKQTVKQFRHAVHNKRMTDKFIIARDGGEENSVTFACDRDSAVNMAMEAAEFIRRGIAENCAIAGGERRITTSIGIAFLTPGRIHRDALAAAGEDEEKRHAVIADAIASLNHRADTALYAAKKAGRNCTYWNDPRTDEAVASMLNPRLPANPAESPPSQLAPA